MPIDANRAPVKRPPAFFPRMAKPLAGEDVC
jgi:hypothetical protein